MSVVLTDGQISLQGDAVRLCIVGYCQQLPVQLVLQVVNELEAAVMILRRLAQPLHNLDFSMLLSDPGMAHVQSVDSLTFPKRFLL